MNKVNHYQLTHPWKEFDRNWIRAISIIKIGTATNTIRGCSYHFLLTCKGEL
jgi:hypothetical protein